MATLSSRAGVPGAAGPAASPRRWLRRLARGASLAVVVLLAWGVLALVNMAEGDLRQVKAEVATQLA